MARGQESGGDGGRLGSTRCGGARCKRRALAIVGPALEVVARHVEGGSGQMSSPSAPGFPVESQREPQLATLGWALRRTAMGLLILMAAVTLGAWLFNASIEPVGPPSQSEYAWPQK